ncbi:Hypothetical predicted protein [Pelobates cultripes]|uniref:Uncharacterized protein n=1 Tax=Pelobates cultripes TaxID=61616 RepID=A0AAD1SGJ3_PELCU|nr:Hypothetical predicted protein [Pelobates cultripes]
MNVTTVDFLLKKPVKWDNSHFHLKRFTPKTSYVIHPDFTSESMKINTNNHDSSLIDDMDPVFSSSTYPCEALRWDNSHFYLMRFVPKKSYIIHPDFTSESQQGFF